MRSTIELRAVPTGRDVGRISNVVRYVAPLEVTYHGAAVRWGVTWKSHVVSHTN